MLGKEVHASKELDYKFTQVASGGLENVLAAPETSCIHSGGDGETRDAAGREEQRAPSRFLYFLRGRWSRPLKRCCAI